MKKLLLLSALFIFIYGNSQTYTVTEDPLSTPGSTTYTIKEQGSGAYQNPQSGLVDYSSFQNGFDQSYLLNISNKKSNVVKKSSNIKIFEDKLYEFNFDFIVILNVDGSQANLYKKSIHSNLIRSGKTIIYSKKKNEFIPNQDFDNFKSVYLNFSSEKISEVDELNKIQITNFDNDILFDAEFLNVPMSKILSPFFGAKLISTPNKTTKDSEFNSIENSVFASELLLKLKELLDLQLITKEEFDEKAKSLKEIILK